MNDSGYYERLAAAYVRGCALRTGVPGTLPEEFLHRELDELKAAETAAILEAGRQAGLKIYAFKDTHGDMPRIRKAMGFLRGIGFSSLLDVGSGRGVFLFPFLTKFPQVSVTAADILPHRVSFLQDVSRGGVRNLTVREADICTQPFPDQTFDVVTMLEVLEHIPEVGAAVRAAVRMAKRYVVVTVPSGPDNNPEHIHLLTKERLTALFEEAGCRRLRFDGVLGHLFLVAVVENSAD